MTNSARQEAFKILKVYRIEAQKECKGCLSLNRYPHPLRTFPSRIYAGEECSFTYSGTPDIPNCPCKNCLIKCTCDNICENFITQAKEYKRSMWCNCDIKVDGPKKYYVRPIGL